MANKFLGQHFLKDPAIIKKIVAAIDPQRGETIVEIGPGHGELTLSLGSACKEAGAKLIAIEKDVRLAEALQKRAADLGSPEIAEGDALELLGAPKSALTLVPPFKIVGNIPYYLTGRLLRIVSEMEQGPSRCVVMVQKEVAERAMERPPRMNRLAASVQFWAKAKIAANVSREAFAPMPEVDSAILLLDRIGSPKEPAGKGAYYDALRVLFAQPRKTVLNNLAARTGKERALEALKASSVDPGLRPQDLSIQNIKQIGDNLIA